MKSSAAALAPQLPNNIEAERSILGAILLDNACLDIAADHLIPGSFFHGHHQQIYQAMLAMHEDEHPIDLVTLTEELQRNGKLESVGGAAYVSQLMDGVPHISNVEHYARIVNEKANLRSAYRQAEFVQQRIQGGADSESVSQQLRDLLDKSEALAPNGNGNGNGNGHLGCSGPEFLTKEFPPHEHLIEQLIPKGASVMIVALPHRLKSFFTTGLALACTVQTERALGKLAVNRPVRTMIVQVEDPPETVQKRLRDFLTTSQFGGCNLENLWVVDRKDFTGFTPQWAKKLVKQALDFKADLIILDVLRRFFEGHGDLNSPTDTSKFLEMMDAIRDVTGAAVVLVHHENKKDADLMNAAAGSFNFPGWAQVMIQIKRKTMHGNITSVEIEVDNKLGESVDPLRMVLDLSSPQPIRLESLDEGDALSEALAEMDTEWTCRTLCEVLGVNRTSAIRRIKKWELEKKIVKVKGGKKGRGGGLAVYSAASAAAD